MAFRIAALLDSTRERFPGFPSSQEVSLLPGTGDLWGVARLLITAEIFSVSLCSRNQHQLEAGGDLQGTPTKCRWPPALTCHFVSTGPTVVKPHYGKESTGCGPAVHCLTPPTTIFNSPVFHYNTRRPRPLGICCNLLFTTGLITLVPATPPPPFLLH